MRIGHDHPAPAEGSEEAAVAALYEHLLDGWNGRDGEGFAAAFVEDGLLIGYDGSEERGRGPIASQMSAIFADHQPAAYVAKVREVRLLEPTVALLRSVVGMIPPGESDVMPDRNAQQTVVAVKTGDGWGIALFQNTPARFDGRPDLAKALTQQLREVARSG